MTAQDERRRHIRFDVNFPIEAEDGAHRRWVLSGVDLSKGGALAIAPAPFAPLARLQIVMRLPGWHGEIPIATEVIVVHCRPAPGQDGKAWQCGLFFNHQTPGAEEEVQTYLGIRRARTAAHS